MTWAACGFRWHASGHRLATGMLTSVIYIQQASDLSLADALLSRLIITRPYQQFAPSSLLRYLLSNCDSNKYRDSEEPMGHIVSHAISLAFRLTRCVVTPLLFFQHCVITISCLCIRRQHEIRVTIRCKNFCTTSLKQLHTCGAIPQRLWLTAVLHSVWP